MNLTSLAVVSEMIVMMMMAAMMIVVAIMPMLLLLLLLTVLLVLARELAFVAETVQNLSHALWFGVWGLGFGVWGLGWGLWLGVWGLGFGFHLCRVREHGFDRQSRGQFAMQMQLSQGVLEESRYNQIVRWCGGIDSAKGRSCLFESFVIRMRRVT